MNPMKKLMTLLAGLALRSLGVGGCLLTACVARAEQVSYLDCDAATGTMTNAVRECTLVTSETRTLEYGWHAVKDDLVFPGGARLVVEGDAHLILCRRGCDEVI